MELKSICRIIKFLKGIRQDLNYVPKALTI